MFKVYDGMPERGSVLYKWQKNQLARFDAMIEKEIAANDGSTVWGKRKATLLACIAKKKNDKWEKQYAVFEVYDGMPERGSVLYKWQKNQLARFDARIEKEIAANDGSTVWGKRKVKLLACIAKKENDKWEKQYAVFEVYDGMPERGSALYKWQMNQLVRFDARIEKEIAANNGSNGAIGEQNLKIALRGRRAPESVDGVTTARLELYQPVCHDLEPLKHMTGSSSP